MGQDMSEATVQFMNDYKKSKSGTSLDFW